VVLPNPIRKSKIRKTRTVTKKSHSAEDFYLYRSFFGRICVCLCIHSLNVWLCIFTWAIVHTLSTAKLLNLHVLRTFRYL